MATGKSWSAKHLCLKPVGTKAMLHIPKSEVEGSGSCFLRQADGRSTLDWTRKCGANEAVAEKFGKSCGNLASSLKQILHNIQVHKHLAVGHAQAYTSYTNSANPHWRRLRQNYSRIPCNDPMDLRAAWV